VPTESNKNLIDTTLLSPMTRILIDCIGLVDALKLLRAHGGRTLLIPEKYREHNQLSKTISTEAQIALIRDFRGDRIELPKYDKVAKQLRNRDIRAKRKTHTAPTLAAEHNLSRRHIFNIWGTDTRQVDLFDDDC
jgi:hypothetical protein